MQAYLCSLGLDVWNSVKKGYKGSNDPTDATDKKLFENDSKARNVLMCGLSYSELVKVMSCKTSKEIWDKLQSIHEGDKKIKEAKLQTYRAQFESLKMTDSETIDSYLLRVNEDVNSIRGLGEELKEESIVKKILRTLPARYDAKAAAIEEAKDLDVFSMDELQGSLTAYEMRIGKPKSFDREAAFNAKNKAKEIVKSDKDDSDDPDDELTANFVQKLKKGQGKYKGKLPFKCFNCGDVGHFAAKCPHKDKEEDDDDIPRKKSFKKNYRSKKGKSKSLMLKKMASSSDDNSDDSGNDATEALFMVTLDEQVEDHMSEKGKSSSDDEDAEINMEGELLAALEELSSERKKHKRTSKRLVDVEEMVVTLKVELEESKRIHEELEAQAVLKTEENNKLEEEVTGLKTQLEKLSQKLNAHQGSSKLNEILSAQRPPHLKFGLGGTTLLHSGCCFSVTSQLQGYERTRSAEQQRLCSEGQFQN
ncbi:hypothetical protein MRB53_006761 [Persea americana]|uniref:Uncharacterized protein n=1 Tax=Persea americana TaxID=3435 RepID=A0ACC2MI15_PERAE|nr:hypothetical protein MRB53_006761 [Persea americana]